MSPIANLAPPTLRAYEDLFRQPEETCPYSLTLPREPSTPRSCPQAWQGTPYPPPPCPESCSTLRSCPPSGRRVLRRPILPRESSDSEVFISGALRSVPALHSTLPVALHIRGASISGIAACCTVTSNPDVDVM